LSSGCIDKKDLDLFKLVDNPDEVYQAIKDFYKSGEKRKRK
jgi:predicted Rossmann-fold nucleotide-binding protein